MERRLGACALSLLVLLSAGCGGRSGLQTESIPKAEPAPSSGPSGVYHDLLAGQTLYSLSRLYDVPLDQLMEINAITDPRSIPAGTPIFIPGASRKLPYPSTNGSMFTWPLRGLITGPFGRRGKRSHHAGVDIDGERGDRIRAAADGRVIKAGAGGAYGKVVIIEHGPGLHTLYAHASRLLVKRGQRVKAGDTIALVGSSGNARGSHLHFEVRRDGRAINPIPLLGEGTSRAADGH